MAKKYLLYIHSEAFSSEQHKSRLVNELLAAHYGTKHVVHAPIPRTIKMTADCPRHHVPVDLCAHKH